MAKTTFTSGGQQIAVETYEPTGGGGPSPAVILLHGADGLSYNGAYRAGAKAVAAAGYRVFLVHYLDRTGERRASFATVFQNFGPWMETARDALAWVATRPEVQPNRVAIFGVSLGAALALGVASGDPRVRCLVSYFGPLPQGAVGIGATLPPTLILHGGADPVVPVANAYAIENLLKGQGTPYEIKVYPGEGLGFHGAAQTDATSRVVAFLARWMGAEPAG
jgi:carboxymethylenebutenolidase